MLNRLTTATVLIAALALPAAHAEKDREISPARKINHDHQKRGQRDQNNSHNGHRDQHGKKDKHRGHHRADSYRTIDGSDNNERKPSINAANTQLKRFAKKAYYSDGFSAMAGTDRPSARLISNVVSAQTELKPNSKGASDYLWQWGQFLDHDIDLTDGVHPGEAAPILIPAGDAHFDPQNTGTVTMALNRSIFDAATGIDDSREQINEITGWIDASNVYGSDDERATALRTNDGSGRLKTSAGDLLPFNTFGLPNAGGEGDNLFLGGDIRANEQVGLTVMHTLFVREHNRLADAYRAKHRNLSGDRIYEKARRVVGGLMQQITYNEFLPALLGKPLPAYEGYNEKKNASIRNEFSSAAYRFGHSALSPQLLRLNADGSAHTAGHLPLRSAFFRPDRLVNEGGIEPILRGLAAQRMQTIDAEIIDDVRNFLFGAPGAGGFDLVALNIQRGRDHGLPGYNDMREHMGFDKATRFSDVTGDADLQQRLETAYGDIDKIDLWVGGLAEQPRGKSHLGPLFKRIVKRQFKKLRDGDRFWYQRALDKKELRLVENSTLANVITRNSSITPDEIQADVFRVTP